MRARIVVFTSAFVLLLSAALAATAAPGPAQANHLSIVKIVNANSGQCLAIGGGSMSYGAAAIQWPCGSGLEQQWIIDPYPYIITTIVNVNSGQCLAIGGGSRYPGAGAIQWPCNNGLRTKLEVLPQHNSELHTGHSGLCLAIGSASKAPGARAAIQWTCNGGYEQKWYVYNA